jgi:hypothetical protein
MSNVDNEPASIVYDPAKAAELLEVSDSGLRRLAPIYESVFGELKRTGKVSKGADDKRPRIWPSEAVSQLAQARARTGRGKPYRTIEAALEAIRDGVESTSEIDFGGRQDSVDPAIGKTLQVLIGEIQALRLEVAELKQGRELLPAQNLAPEIRNSSAPVDNPAHREENHGVLARAALWIEQRLKGN